MSRRIDPHKLTVWRERLHRFRNSGLSANRFCAQEGVSSPSFYKWRKRLKQELRVTKPRKESFREVAVIPPSAGVLIQLSCGTRIEVGAGQPEMVRAVVDELMRAGVHAVDAATC